MSFIPGIPVPIGGIERALGRLWEESGESKTRASLINLAIYSEDVDSLEKNAAIIQNIAGEHAMRALLIHADPNSEGSSADAWISMNCYLRGTRGGEVCSEQISFRLRGEAARSLQNVVFSHLDSDLPLILWWQADFCPPIDGRLWRWVDRLLFDSRDWKHSREQFDLICKIGSLTEDRTILCDLNWTRGFSAREALACMFDSPLSLPELHSLQTIQIDHAPNHRTTALLLIGWLADRLGWHLTLPGKNPQFQDARGGAISVMLEEKEGAGINRIQLFSSQAKFEALREAGSGLSISSAKGEKFSSTCRKVRAPREDTTELLLAELARSSNHALYSRSVKAVEALWE